MLKHFTGRHDHKVDAKGRVSLPTEFRRVLDAMGSSESIFIVPQYDDPRAHVGFTTEGYANLIARHNAREYPSFAAMKRQANRLISRARQVQVDTVGRIVLAEELRSTLGMDDAVRFVGDGDSFEIWTPAGHADYEAELYADATDDDVLDRRGLH